MQFKQKKKKDSIVLDQLIGSSKVPLKQKLDLLSPKEPFIVSIRSSLFFKLDDDVPLVNLKKKSGTHPLTAFLIIHRFVSLSIWFCSFIWHNINR